MNERRTRSTDPTDRSGWSAPLVVMACAAAAVSWALSSHLGGTYDSIEYLNAARSIARGDGLVNTAGDTFTQYGPLYPLVLAALSRLGLDLLTAARVVALASMVVSTLLASAWTARLTGSRRSAPLGGAISILVWPILMTRFAWSEPLFIALTLAAGLSLTRGLQQRSTYWIATGGAFTGLATLARYSGLFLLGAVVYVAFAWGRSWRDTAKVGLVHLGAAGALPAAWVVRNLAANPGEPLGPRYSSAYSVRQVMADLGTGLASLFSPPGVPPVVRVVVLVLVLGVFARSVHLLRGRKHREWWVLTLLPPVLAALYTVGITISALQTNLDSLAETRLLCPAYPLLAIGIVSCVWCAADEALRNDRRREGRLQTLRLLTTAAPPVVLIVFGAVAGSRYGYSLQPRERLSAEVTESRSINAATSFETSPLFSNNAPNVAWVLDRPVRPISSAWTTHLAASRAQHADPVLIWTESAARDTLRLDEVADHCTLLKIDDYRDGTLFRVRSCQPGR